MTGTIHTYRTSLTWKGSTGEGYAAYDRTHSVVAPPAEATLTLSSDPAFSGDPSLLSPEQLLVLSASSCQLLSFIAVAARSRIDVVAYRDSAEAVMPEDDSPTRITRIDLRPIVTIRSGDAGAPSDDRLLHLCEVAHEECYVANSLRTEVVVIPTFERQNTPSEDV